MSAQVKRFREHSERWQRAAKRQGIVPERWDRWRKLSPKSRKNTNPRDYAKGSSVREQIRDQLLDAATAKVTAVHSVERGARRADGTAIRQAAVRRNLAHPDAGMTLSDLRRIGNLNPQQLAREIDDSLGRHYRGTDRSPFWYEKRG